MNNSGVCQYLDVKGRKCAIGCLIDPKLYNPTIEGLSLSSALVELNDNKEQSFKGKTLTDILQSSGIDSNDETIATLLIQLQSIHDFRLECEWADELKALALRLNLQYNYAQEANPQTASS